MSENSKYKRDCFAFESKNYIMKNSKAIKKEVEIFRCNALDREDCSKCSFYKPANEFNRMAVESDIERYSSVKKEV